MNTPELILLAKDGDADAFSELITSRQQRMYRVARSYLSEQMDIDDAIAEAILACWQQLRSLRSPEFFETWLMRILINKCRDIYNQSLRTISLDDAECSDLSADCSANIGFTELISLLDPRYRPVFVLYYSEGFRINEISQITGLPEGTIGSWLARGREQLRKELTKGGLE